LSLFLSPAGISLTKLSLAGNTLIIPRQGEFGKVTSAEDGKNDNLFYSVPALGHVFDVEVLDDKVPDVVLADGPGPGLSPLIPAVQTVLLLSCVFGCRSFSPRI
jgi:hypothetical protein